MNTNGYDTPEDAAMEGFPPQYCRVIASRVRGDLAYVLLDTHPEGWRYLYGSHCYRQNGKWGEISSSNGGGWHQAGDDPDVGTFALWGEAPPGAIAARVRFAEEITEEPLTDGVYLVVRWAVPSDVEWPGLIGFRFADHYP